MPQFGSYPILTSIDPADTILFRRDSDGTINQITFSDLIASIHSNTDGAQTVTYVNTDTTLTPALGYVVANTSANITLTLPLASASSGITFGVLNKGVGHVSIEPSGSDTIAGLSSITLGQFESASMTSDGSNLFSN
jgi:hypothetical protein